MALFKRRQKEPVVIEARSQVPKVPRIKRSSGYIAAQSVARYDDFRFSYASASQEIVMALPKLRARSRWLVRNNPLATRFLMLMQMNIVGPAGFIAATRAKQPNGALDQYGNEQVEAAWSNWCEEATADGQMSLRAATNAVVRAFCQDGEAFVQFRFGRKYRHGMALHFIEADQIDDELNVGSWTETGNEIRMGVEIDGDERPVAYHVLTYHPGDTIWHAIKGRKYRRIPASQMLHIYIKDRPGQTRGVPPMSPIMLDAKMLAGYREAEITNRRVAAAKMGFFTSEKAEGSLAEIADDEESDGELVMEVSPGEFTKLPTGMQFQQFDPSSSGTDYADFEKQITRSIAAGLGPSYHDLAMDLEGVSYSSIRQGALTDRDFYRLLQAFVCERFMKPVFWRWLDRAFDFGIIQGIPPSDLKKRKFYNATKFHGRGWAWVDPQKEIQAAVTAIENGLNSRTRIANEQGVEFEDIVQDLVREQAAMEELTPVVNEPVAPQDDEQ